MPEELTEYQMLKALYNKFILGIEEPVPLPPPPEPPPPEPPPPEPPPPEPPPPEPPPPEPPLPPPDLPSPSPDRPQAVAVVTVDKCHLRFIDHFDGAGKAVWGSYPKGSDNPKRDRYLIYLGVRVGIYMDGEIRWGIYRGAVKGTGGNHGWEVCPGQTFNGHVVPGKPRLYILCRDANRI